MQTMIYNLKDFTNITFNGFEITLPEETINRITELALQVGSPTYIRTPTFEKKENNLKSSNLGYGASNIENKKKRKDNRAVEILNDDDWESIRTFQATVIEQKVGIDAQIDLIRASLNKMTEANCKENSNKILEILNNLMLEGTSEDKMMSVGNAIFEIASNNRFFSKLYADLYTLLVKNLQIMSSVFEKNFSEFMDIFKNIESANSEEDYEKFCKVNKNNERRKSLSLFFVNLTHNGIIKKEQIIEISFDLLNKVLVLIKEENKKSEVDEIIENISILYNKKWMESTYLRINDSSFLKVIESLSLSKSKDYLSLSNKSIFKCMDIVEM